MQIEFFGQPNCRRLAAYHAAARHPGSSRAMVICSPLGHEYIRTHWALRLVAKQLARKGVHVVRFDYRGHGDSFGTIDQVSSLDDWRDDLSAATDYLKNVSGVPSVSLLGLRAGASLATEVANDRSDINSIVVWEPINDGSTYLNELRKVHRTMTDLWFRKVSTANDDTQEEILGWCYQRMLLEEMAQWRADLNRLSIPQLLIDLTCSNPEGLTPESPLQKCLLVDDSYSWNRLCDLEAAWLRPKTARLIVETIEDMFDRLESKGMLETQLAGSAG